MIRHAYQPAVKVEIVTDPQENAKTRELQRQFVNGTWHTCDDGELRPVLLGAMIAAAGRRLSVPYAEYRPS